MSRIGKQPIAIPDGVEIKISDTNKVTVKGKLGVLQLPNGALSSVEIT